ncbi:endogenous retrovirus group PABLB member 1 Env polyprotein-like [Zootoca vivipara]|uniref:endogenous retrovirus group PABLB member 1 Env polyprotein-like n=1 Tax=Zootoca vivipara TaxID=8524 RepID=UPI00293C0EF5|nr:endogenous retrovirus group PABLB member 1 Env polyprotein-like [Zootoca vivipara]XP_060134343.1 endogenous retrovirus group PABLB member 1 Env polyprotein-like [Zootoca vivipara]
MSDNRISSPPVILSLLEVAPRCFRFNHDSSRFLGPYPYCNWTYEYVNGSSCFLNVTTQRGRPKVTINNVTRYMTFYQQATCRDFHSWFDWMKKSWRSTCVLQSNMWLLCGKKAYKEIPSAFSGTCTLGVVIQLVYKLDALPHTRLRNKHEVNPPFTQYTDTQIARSILPLLGVAMNYRDLHHLANWTEALFNDTVKGMKLINTELQDVILASERGVCALIHSHCCMYVQDNGPNITHTIQEMENLVAAQPLQPAVGFDPWEWLLSWLPNGAWIRKTLLTLIGLACGLVMLCCCIQCLPSLFGQCMTWFQAAHLSTGISRGAFIARYQRLPIWLPTC